MPTWIAIGLFTFCLCNVAKTSAAYATYPQLYVSDEKLPFSEAVKECLSFGMRLLGTSSDLNAIFANMVHPDLSAALEEDIDTEFWFLNTPLYRINYHRSFDNKSLCHKMTVQKYYKGYSVVHSDETMCSESHRFICENPRREKLNVVNFLISAYTTSNYEGAREACETRGLRLAHVRTLKQNKQLSRQIRTKLDMEKGLFWIGEMDTSQFTQSSNFRPDDAVTTCVEIYRSDYPKDCTALAFSGESKASPCMIVNCEMKLRFVCESRRPDRQEDDEEFRRAAEDLRQQNWSTRTFSTQGAVDWFRRFTHGLFHGWS